jgi:ATP-dependent exoDNAse (exonuclease V) alpha subunit
MRTAKLEEIVRQKDPFLKSEVELLAKGQTAAAIESLKKRGKVNEIANPQERIHAIARKYVANRERTLIVSPDNKSRHALNAVVRQELKASGAIGTEEHSLSVLVPRQDMTGAERTWARGYETQDVVRYSRGSRLTGLEAGSYARVIGINGPENLVTIQTANGNQVTYDPKRLSGVTVYQSVEREFSTGDRIQFTAPDKQLGVANRELGTIQKIDPDGNMSLRLEDGRQIQFNAMQHPHFDHGYAVTSHSSQGLTADQVLINVDTAMHPDLLSSRFAYVAVSRASNSAEIYTNDATDLGHKLSGATEKTSDG